MHINLAILATTAMLGTACIGPKVAMLQFYGLISGQFFFFLLSVLAHLKVKKKERKDNGTIDTTQPLGGSHAFYHACCMVLCDPSAIQLTYRRVFLLSV